MRLSKRNPDNGENPRARFGASKTASFAGLFDHLAKAILPFAVEKVSEGGVRCFSLVYPDTQFLLEHDILADGTEGNALALRFEMEGVAGSELQAFAEGLGENHATGFIESQLSRHDGIMKWNYPLVDAIRTNPGCYFETRSS